LLRLADHCADSRAIPASTIDGDLSEATPGPADLPSNRDRRAFPRRDSGCDVRVHCLVMSTVVSSQQLEWLLHATPLQGSLLDLSMNGLAFLINRPLEPSQRVLLRVSSRTTDLSVDTSATVVRCTREDSGAWKVVGRFDQNLTLEQAHELGRYLATATIV